MKWLEQGRRRSAIKGFLTRVGPALHARYGPRASYTLAEIRQIINGSGIDPLYLAYAYVMFMEQRAFDQAMAQFADCDYGALREEIAELCFEGDMQFSASDAVSLGLAFSAPAVTSHDTDADGLT